MSNSRKTSRVAAALSVAVCAVMAFAALGGVGLAQTSGGPGKGQYGKKVATCHKGKTISISRSALPAHLRHGDAAGTCAAAQAKKAKAAKAKAAKAKAHKAKAEKAKAEKAKGHKSDEDGSAKGGGKGKGKEKGKGKG